MITTIDNTPQFDDQLPNKGILFTNDAVEKQKKTVEEWLNEVDYLLDKHYIPGEFALEFISFIKLVNGPEGEEHKSPVLHYRMLDKIGGRRQDIINMVFRGAAKTTLLGEYLFLYIAVYGEIPGFGEINLAIYVSDSIENGVKNMRKNLEYRWGNSEFLQMYVPEIKFTDIRWEFKNKAGKIFIVKGYGAKTGVRGTKELGQRPVLAVLDDLISDEDARSETVIASVEDTVNKAIEYALHPTRKKVIWSGTPFNARDPLYKAVESGAYYVNVYPVCNEFPCSREDFVSAWPDRFTYEAVNNSYQKAKAKGKVKDFNQEMMLRIMSDEERLVPDEDIRWYKRRELLLNKDSFNFYITTDFATSERQAADWSVISVWAVSAGGHWFWVDGIVKRQVMSKNIDDLFRLGQKYQPQEVGIEITGQQKGFVSWIESEMLRRNIWFTLSREKVAGGKHSAEIGLRPKTDKLKHFMNVQPWFAAGKMHFPIELEDDPRILEFLNEIRLVAVGAIRSKKDDFLDTISMLSDITYWMPSDENSERFEADEDDIDPDFYDDEESGAMDSYTV